MASRPKSVTPEALLRIQDKINDDPEALKEFVKSPSAYLVKNGIDVSDRHRKDLDAAIREMSFGPKSFDQITKMRKPSIGISISIRIRF